METLSNCLKDCDDVVHKLLEIYKIDKIAGDVLVKKFGTDILTKSIINKDMKDIYSFITGEYVNILCKEAGEDLEIVLDIAGISDQELFNRELDTINRFSGCLIGYLKEKEVKKR